MHSPISVAPVGAKSHSPAAIGEHPAIGFDAILMVYMNPSPTRCRAKSGNDHAACGENLAEVIALHRLI